MQPHTCSCPVTLPCSRPFPCPFCSSPYSCPYPFCSCTLPLPLILHLSPYLPMPMSLLLPPVQASSPSTTPTLPLPTHALVQALSPACPCPLSYQCPSPFPCLPMPLAHAKYAPHQASSRQALRAIPLGLQHLRASSASRPRFLSFPEKRLTNND